MTNYKLLPEQPTKEMLDALPSDFIRAVFIGAYPTAYTAVTEVPQQECKPLSEDKIQRLFNYSSYPMNWSDLREIIRIIEKAHNIRD